LNAREIAIYEPVELQTGQSWFSAQPRKKRQGFRKVFDFGSLPNATAKTIAHGLTLTADFHFTRIFATATDTSGFNAIPIPFASPTLANNISIEVDSTNVTITTGSDRTAFNQCFVILEFLKG